MKDRTDARILVVDDTPENLRLLARTLSGAGYRVRAAPGGEIGLRMARAEPPARSRLRIRSATSRAPSRSVCGITTSTSDSAKATGMSMSRMAERAACASASRLLGLAE